MVFFYFQLFIYFFIGASNTEKSQSRDIWNENLELKYIKCGQSLRKCLLLFLMISLPTSAWLCLQHSHKLPDPVLKITDLLHYNSIFSFLFLALILSWSSHRSTKVFLSRTAPADMTPVSMLDDTPIWFMSRGSVQLIFNRLLNRVREVEQDTLVLNLH